MSIYDSRSDSFGVPSLIGTLFYESSAWDVRLVLTAGTTINVLFDSMFRIANLNTNRFDSSLRVYTGLSQKFDATLDILAARKFDATYDIGIGSRFDSKLAIVSNTKFDAKLGIGRFDSTMFDGKFQTWNAGSKATLYGYFVRPDGSYLSGIGTIRLSAPAHLHGSAVLPAPVQVNVQNGFFAIQLYPNADLTPKTTVYLFTLEKWTLIFRVPRKGSVWLHQLEHLQLADPIFFQDVITSVTSEGTKTYIVVRIGTKVFRLPAEQI